MIIVRERYERTEIECEDSWNYHDHRTVEFHGSSLGGTEGIHRGARKPCTETRR